MKYTIEMSLILDSTEKNLLQYSSQTRIEFGLKFNFPAIHWFNENFLQCMCFIFWNVFHFCECNYCDDLKNEVHDKWSLNPVNFISPIKLLEQILNIRFNVVDALWYLCMWMNGLTTQRWFKWNSQLLLWCDRLTAKKKRNLKSLHKNYRHKFNVIVDFVWNRHLVVNVILKLINHFFLVLANTEKSERCVRLHFIWSLVLLCHNFVKGFKFSFHSIW